MSDTPIFDALASERDWNRMTDATPNGKTSHGVGFFARVVREERKYYAPDPDLDGPLPRIGAQNPEEVEVSGEDEEEIYIAPFTPVNLQGLLKAQDRAEEEAEVRMKIQKALDQNHRPVYHESPKFTSLVESAMSLEAAEEKTHEFPRVDVTGFVDKKIKGGLYDYLGASHECRVESQDMSFAGHQRFFRSFLDGIYDEARAEIAKEYPGPVITAVEAPVTVDQDDLAYSVQMDAQRASGRPMEVLLVEEEVTGEELVGEAWQGVLDRVRAQAKEAHPHHIATKVEVDHSDDFTKDSYTVRLKGVEGALPVYRPLFEGDVNEE